MAFTSPALPRCLLLPALFGLGACLGAAEGAAHLKIAQGARSAAMGTAFGMVPASLEGLWYNPAALGGISGPELSFSHLSWIGDTSSEYAALGLGLGKAALGLSLQYLATQDVLRDAFGREGAGFDNTAMTAMLGAAWDFGAVSLGAGAKYLGQSFNGRASSGVAADLGLQLKYFQGRLLLNAALQNLGAAAEAGSVPPLAWRAGLGLAPLKGLLLTQEVQSRLARPELSYLAGLEARAAWSSMGASLRAGYDLAAAAPGGLAGLSLGGGLSLAGLSLDYAFVPLGALGSSHRASLAFAFAPSASPPPPARKPGTASSKEALAAYKAGKYKQAILLYESLIREKPGNATLWRNAAMCYFNDGQRGEARRCFQKALRLKPDSTEIRDFMARQGL